jgi:hypothetical protein
MCKEQHSDNTLVVVLGNNLKLNIVGVSLAIPPSAKTEFHSEKEFTYVVKTVNNDIRRKCAVSFPFSL